MNLGQANKTLSTNSNLSHYRIVSKIGAGGMGEVFLATDTKLKQKVALKLLPPEFTDDIEGDPLTKSVMPLVFARNG